MSTEDRELHSRLRAAVQATGAPRRVHRWRWLRSTQLGNAGASIAIFGVVCLGISVAEPLAGPGRRALLSVLALLVALNLHGLLLKAIYQHPDLLAQALLPASREWVFRRQLRLGLRQLLWLPLAGAVVAWIVQGTGRGTEVPWPLAGLAGALLGTYLVALGFLALRWRHAARAYGLGWVGLVTLWLGSNFAPAPLRAAVISWLNEQGDLLVGVLPTGWLVGPGHRWLTGQAHASDALWLLPALALTTLLPSVRRWLEQRYQFREAVLLDYAAEVPEDCSAEDREALAGHFEAPQRTGLTEITDRILSREFLLPASEPTSGWIERWVWRWWTPRERLLAEWDWATGPTWTFAWKTGAMLLGGSLVLTLSGRLLGWTWLESALPVGGVLGGLSSLPVLIGLAGGRLQTPFGATAKLSPYAVYPRGLKELLGLLNKVSLVRTLAALPLVTAFGACAAVMQERPWWVGVDFAVRAGFAAWAITPAWLVVRVGQVTNDVNQLRAKSLLILGWHLGCLALLAALLVAGFLSEAGWWCLLGAPVAARVWERGYRLAFDRHWFDLMKRE